MKKALTTLIAVAIFSLPFNAIAVVKAGATCTKLGATSTYSGKKYTCIKSGAKLLWNKGVKIPKPKATPTPTSVQTPVATPTPIPTPIPTPTAVP